MISLIKIASPSYDIVRDRQDKEPYMHTHTQKLSPKSHYELTNLVGRVFGLSDKPKVERRKPYHEIKPVFSKQFRGKMCSGLMRPKLYFVIQMENIRVVEKVPSSLL